MKIFRFTGEYGDPIVSLEGVSFTKDVWERPSIVSRLNLKYRFYQFEVSLTFNLPLECISELNSFLRDQRTQPVSQIVEMSDDIEDVILLFGLYNNKLWCKIITCAFRGKEVLSFDPASAFYPGSIMESSFEGKPTLDSGFIILDEDSSHSLQPQVSRFLENQ